MIHLLAAGVAMCLGAHLDKADCSTDGEVDADRFIQEVLPGSGALAGIYLPDTPRGPIEAQDLCKAVPGATAPLKAVPVYDFTTKADDTKIGIYYACMPAPSS